MRSFAIAALVTALVAGAGFTLAPGAPSDGVAAVPSGAAATAARPTRTFYQWTDERGVARFASSLEEVPVAWRERAGQIEVDAAAFAPKNAAAAARTEAGHEVTIYTAPWCGWCRKTIAFLDERGVEYVNKDIEADAAHEAELVAKSGGTAIPFVEIDGTQIRGYNPIEMAALLE
jgi:glutaredoxin